MWLFLQSLSKGSVFSAESQVKLLTMLITIPFLYTYYLLYLYCYVIITSPTI